MGGSSSPGPRPAPSIGFLGLGQGRHSTVTQLWAVRTQLPPHSAIARLDAPVLELLLVSPGLSLLWLPTEQGDHTWTWRNGVTTVGQGDNTGLGRLQGSCCSSLVLHSPPPCPSLHFPGALGPFRPKDSSQSASFPSAEGAFNIKTAEAVRTHSWLPLSSPSVPSPGAVGSGRAGAMPAVGG